MRMPSAIALVALPMLAISSPGEAKARLSDAQVRQRIIQASIDGYPGSCPCPYSSARNGSRCGGRSAWSRAGGYAPVCYAREVSKADVRAWRARH